MVAREEVAANALLVSEKRYLSWPKGDTLSDPHVAMVELILRHTRRKKVGYYSLYWNRLFM